MLRIFYGRESVDKDRFIYDHMDGETALLVPDQYTLEAEKDLLSRTGRKGLLDVEILGFSRLSDRVLNECGKSSERPINKYGRYMLLVKILQDLNDSFGVYRNMYLRPSFVEMTNDFIAQIRQNNLGAAELRGLLEGLSSESLLKKKLTDICLIYDEYEKNIEGKYIDTEDSITFMKDRIKESTYVAERTFWISGFDSFTPKNLDVIGELIKNAKEVNVVLTYDEGGRDAHLFALTGTLIALLKEKASEAGSEYEVKKIEGYPVTRPAGLAALERELYAVPAAPCDDSTSITVVSGAGIYQELETAAAFIHGLVRDEGYRYSDIAVICNSIEKNEAGIRMVFGRHGIPVFVDSKRKIASSPLVIYFMAYMGIAIGDIKSSEMLRLIKTGYCGFEQKVCDELENYVIENRIRKNGWKKPFEKIRKGHEDMLPLIEDVRKNLMEEIGTLSQKIDECRTVHEAVDAIISHMTFNAGLVDKINEKAEKQAAAGFAEEAQITVQAWEYILDILEQIDEIIGEEEGLIDRLPEIIYAGIEAAEAGIIPPVCDGIAIGTAQRSRIASAKAIVVLGADEGVLPQSGGTENLLNDDELGFIEENADIVIARTDAVRRNEEALGIYRTFSRASEHLWIGTAMADEKGDKVKPSSVINTMKRIFGSLKIESDMFDDECDDRLFSGRGCAADNMTAALRDYLEGRELDDKWKEAVGWFMENDSETMERIESGLFHSPKKARMDRGVIKELYQRSDGEFSISPSELENYSRCPFMHFLDYGIRPEERRIVEMASREIGDVYHDVFMKLAQQLTVDGMPLTDPGSPWMNITREDFDELMDELVSETVTGYKGGFMYDNPEEKYRTERLLKLSKDIGWVLVEHVRAGDIKEAMFEANFGRGSAIPPVVFDAEGDTVYIEGKIDRLDILGNERVKVIDYKSGSDEFSKEEALKGWKLQLMVYLKAGMQYGEERKPAGVFYFHVKEPNKDMSDKSKEKISETIQNEIYKSFKMDGAVIDDPDVIESIAGEFTGTSEIISVKATGDRGYAQSGSKKKVFTESEFEEFQKDVDKTVQKICDGIVTGDIDIFPKKHIADGYGACTYCRYSSMCGFDSAFDECRYDWI